MTPDYDSTTTLVLLSAAFLVLSVAGALWNLLVDFVERRRVR